jgi:pilus assembly protein Flp/PilA
MHSPSTLQIAMIRASFDAIVRFLREDDGPTAVEYAVVLAMIIGVCIAAVNQLSSVVGNSFDASGNAIESAFSN